MIEWRKCKLGDVSLIKGGKRIPKGKNLTELPTQHPYIRTRDINEHKIIINELLYVPDDVFHSIKNYIVEKDDIIISIVGTIGLCAIVPKELHLANLTENCTKIVNIDDKKLEMKFLFYYLISPNGQDEIEQRNVGSTQPKLPLYYIKDIPIPLPPLPEQKAIASVLSSLDDKIDLLNRQNKTLEAMAETIFRQWFVEEADEEWEEGVLSEFCDVIDCLHSKKPEPLETNLSSYFLLQVYNIGQNGEINLSNKYYVSEKDYKEWTKRIELIGGEIIISKTGRVAAMAQIPNFIKTGIGRNLVALRIKNIFTKEFLKDLMLSSWMKRNIHLKTSDGTILQSIHVNSISNLPVFNPGEKAIKDYSEIIRPFHIKINQNILQVRKLEKLRDTLLPKLMSGEVRIEL